jgi:TonB family protein
MSLNQVSNAFDLLGLADKPLAPLRVLESAHEGEPQFQIGWGDFRQSLWSSVRALVSPPFGFGKFLGAEYFRDCWVERRVPYRAVAAAALWHVVFVVMPFPELQLAPKHNPAFDNTVLTWSGPIDDLPLLAMAGEKPKPTFRGDAAKPLSRAGADAFHPRQRILTDTVHPTHPRQTLINSAAPPEPPKILPTLPNVVQLQQNVGPARPHIEISERTLAKLRPKVRRVAAVTTTPLPDIASSKQNPAEITMAISPNAPVRPKLELNAGTAPRVAQHAQTGEVGPAPEIGTTQSASANGSTSTFIALSATPGPPTLVVQPPAGNLSARVAISPEGKQPGTPGGSPNANTSNGGAGGNADSRGGLSGANGAGKNSTAVSISGGNPSPKSGISGLSGGRISATPPHASATRSTTQPIDDPAPVRTGPPNFGALPAGAPAEQIFSTKKVYKLLVNMPNLNSATGSWVLNFSELRVDGSGMKTSADDLVGPEPTRKTDPKYPRTFAEERIEGEVILYAVIRKDGSVDSIQLVHGIDEQLDVFAMQALGQWKFRPASRQGAPVDLEAIVHIPFHAPRN